MIKTTAILAGGLNRRMGGRSKYLCTVDGVPLIQRILLVLRDRFSRIIIISQDDPEVFRRFGCDEVYPDIFPHKGPLAGIHAALSVAENEAVFTIGCDYPFPDITYISQLCDFWKEDMDALIPRHPKGFEPLHAIYGQHCRSLAEDLLANSDNVRILQMLNLVNTVYHETSYHRSFTNLNTPEDFEKVLKNP
jgi:molybdopterin-guanine dinucleotide biosynthesis protein A